LQAFNQVKQLPIKPTAHSRSYAWFNLVSRFSEETRNRWGGAQVQAQASKQTENAPITKKQPKTDGEKKPDPNMKKHPATVREYYEDSYMVSQRESLLSQLTCVDVVQIERQQGVGSHAPA
jgi:hypothetical protein